MSEAAQITLAEAVERQEQWARELLAKENAGGEAVERYDGVLFIRKDVCIRAILSALQSSASIPEGCVVVPAEPDEAMLRAAIPFAYADTCRDTVSGDQVAAIYKAMLAASPIREEGK